MERFLPDRWAPPWSRHEHVSRYEWASQFGRECVVIDVACGIGYGADILAQKGAPQVYGYDISAGAIREAQKRFSQNARVCFGVANAVKIPLPDNHVDLYISFETIEHVHDDQVLLAEALRVLKPCGKFICSTPNREMFNPGNALEDPPANPYHVREYSRGELDLLLRKYFSRVEWYGQTFLPSQYCRLLQRLGRISRKIARRAHQVQRVCGLLWRDAVSHHPNCLKSNGIPDVFIAVCSNRPRP